MLAWTHERLTAERVVLGRLPTEEGVRSPGRPQVDRTGRLRYGSAFGLTATDEAQHMPKAAKPNIAICYDFDGTLIRGNMQENSFLPGIGTSPKEFWGEVKERARRHDMDEVLSYMRLMIEGADRADQPCTRKALMEHGEEVDLFPGVKDWFGCVNGFCRSLGATVDHFVISSGLEEMIEGSGLAQEFKHVFASGFVFNASGAPVFAARSVNYTTKTQYLFRINKGIWNSWDNEEINQFTPEDNRPQPFSRMIYIGDGETDVPAMKMVNYQGGYTIAVYPPIQEGRRRQKKEMEKQTAAEDLVRHDRAQFAVGADYRRDGPVYGVVTMLVQRIVEECRQRMNLNTR